MTSIQSPHFMTPIQSLHLTSCCSWGWRTFPQHQHQYVCCLSPCLCYCLSCLSLLGLLHQPRATQVRGVTSIWRATACHLFTTSIDLKEMPHSLHLVWEAFRCVYITRHDHNTTLPEKTVLRSCWKEENGNNIKASSVLLTSSLSLSNVLLWFLIPKWHSKACYCLHDAMFREVVRFSLSGCRKA